MDDIAFRNFYQQTAPALLSYLRLLSRDAALAEDLLQESFLRLLRAAPSSLNEAQLKSYLYKTATSAMTDHWRKHRREQTSTEDALDEMLPDQGASVADPELSYDLNRVLEALNSRQQALLWLAYVEGFQHQEIAELLGLDDKSVRVLLQRARRKAAALLSGDTAVSGAAHER